MLADERGTATNPLKFRQTLRFRVLTMMIALAFLTYMDRVCISITAPAIAHDLHLSAAQMGIVFSSFTAMYALFEIPTGWWADKRGGRAVLTRIVAWWSTFTALTAVTSNFSTLVAVRALFGMGEAGAWPSVTAVLGRWFPQQERGTAQGIFFMGAHLGGGITPLFVALLASRFGWRCTFPILSVFGFIWAAFWFRWYRDDPGIHPSITSQELEWIESNRSWQREAFDRSIIQRALASSGFWGLCAMYFTQTYGFNLYVTWLPTYLSHDKHFQGGMLGIVSGLPLLLSVPADFAGGLTTDRLSRSLGLRRGRCIVGCGSLTLAAVLLFAGTLCVGWISGVLIALAAAMSNFLLGASWSVCADMAGRHAATLAAAMNTSGQIGGILSPIVFSLLISGRTRWSMPLFITAGLYLLGALCWYFIHPERPLMKEGLNHVAVEREPTCS